MFPTITELRKRENRGRWVNPSAALGLKTRHLAQGPNQIQSPASHRIPQVPGNKTPCTWTNSDTIPSIPEDSPKFHQEQSLSTNLGIKPEHCLAWPQPQSNQRSFLVAHPKHSLAFRGESHGSQWVLSIRGLQHRPALWGGWIINADLEED